ncbi:MAG: UDP-3-O-(3-hydroxymyristoyl)glucosamine N-acyltransferase [Gemmatimonadetes bacterium]|nr:UDP-3-O-(3-hydroxymyristoyl)glucosamine N-acyltransferase [Gemmatimonadota bacterium]
MQASFRLTAGEIAKLAGGKIVGDGDTLISGVCSLEKAGPGDLSLLATARFLAAFRQSRAGAVLVPPDFANESEGPPTRILVESPRRALIRVLSALAPTESPVWGIHHTARVGAGVRWRGRIAVAGGATIGRDVRLGANCVLGPYVVIGAGVRIGDECRIHAHAVVEASATLGDRVVLHAGARIGTPGFGYARSDSGHERIPHVAGCLIGDDVEIGSNTTIDCGGIDDTVIGAGTKIDNLVQVAHHVRIGRRCLIMAQVGIAGSSVVEDDVVLAGQAGLADHVTVGREARVAAQSGVIGDVAPGSVVSGYPARNHREVLRHQAVLKRLAPLSRRLEELASAHDGQR